jgi:DNA-directed RNA polymerase specialized sigma24 family protein
MGQDFEAWMGELRPRLARAFVAAHGPERGEDALAEALSYAWEHFDALQAMANPAGYLYRVGQSRSKPPRRPGPLFPAPTGIGLPDVEPGLAAALERLSDRQRVCVALIHVYECTFQEVADLLAISRSSVQRHVERGLESLRQSMGATT